MLACPVAGSIRITLPASLLPTRIAPLSAAIGPSTLLPSQAQTVFQLWRAAMTPGIATEGGGKTSCGGWVCLEMGMPKGLGGVRHFAVKAA